MRRYSHITYSYYEHLPFNFFEEQPQPKVNLTITNFGPQHKNEIGIGAWVSNVYKWWKIHLLQEEGLKMYRIRKDVLSMDW